MKSGYKFFFLMVCNFALLIFVQAIHPQLMNNKPQTINELQADSSSHLRPDLSGEVERSETKPDYRNHINIPEYDPSLMPLNYTNRSTGVWTELNPKVPRVDYYALDFYSLNDGIFVGDNGKIILTNDCGQTFYGTYSGTLVRLNDVKYISKNKVIICGDGGTILSSSDNGITWLSKKISDNNLNAIHVIKNNVIYIVGDNGTILKSINYGNNWISLQSPQPFANNYALHFWNHSEGIISCDGGKMLKTTDGGNHWVTKQAGDSYRLLTVAAVDSYHIVAGGEFLKFVYSSDRGETWLQTSLGVSNPIRDIAFFDTKTGIAVGPGNSYLKTTNKGLSWQMISKPFFAELSIITLDTSVCISIGENLKFFRSDDKGESWNKLILNNNIKDISFIDSLNGFFISQDLDGGLFGTNNGGFSWYKNVNFPYSLLSGPLSILYQYNAKIYIGGYNSNIIVSSDHGNSWYKATITNLSDTFNTYINGILFIDENRGLAYTSKGYVLLTNDKGEQWEVISSFTTTINNLYMIDSLHGYICSNNLYFTEDGGYNWQIVDYVNTSSEFLDIKYLTVERRIIVTSDSIYISTNAGNSWENVYKASGKIYFLGDSLIFIIGRESSVSYNGGNSWERIENLLNEGDALSATAINNTHIIVAGGIGLILKFTNDLLSKFSDSSNGDKKNIYLLEIYPNPTNALAHIVFKNFHSSVITIGVYDLLGKEIHLQNLGLMNMGSHEYLIDFNKLNNSLSSGIYFIKLIDKQSDNENYILQKIIYLK